MTVTTEVDKKKLVWDEKEKTWKDSETSEGFESKKDLTRIGISLEEFRMKFPEAARWLDSIDPCTKDNPFVIKGKTGEFGFNVKFYTTDNVYNIVGFPPPHHETGYLGCTASARKPRAGEHWTRGNDLPDGVYSEETWIKILKAIVRYELVKLAPVQICEGDKESKIN